MFDIGFFEIVLVFVVGLLVIGPERLPEVIRKLMLWRGRMMSQFSQFKDTLEKEIGADEVRQQLQNESILKDYKKGRELVKSMQNEMFELHSKGQQGLTFKKLLQNQLKPDDYIDGTTQDTLANDSPEQNSEAPNLENHKNES